MGFLSKITKPFKKIWKGVKKVASKAWKGVKKFASSKIGKLIIAAAIVYFTVGAGSGALSAASTSGTAAGGAGTTVAGGAAGTASAGIVPTGTAAAGITAAPIVTAPVVAPAAVSGIGAGGGAAGITAAPGLVSQAGTALASGAEWMAANPMATMVGGQMLSAATAEEGETQEEYDKRRRDESNIAGVSGTGEGSPISLGLVRQAQQKDLAAPTYAYTPQSGAQNA